MLFAYLIVFFSGFITSSILHRIVIPVATKYGYVDQPGERKLHRIPVPYGGGIAIFLSLAFVSCFGYLFISWDFISESLSDYVSFDNLKGANQTFAIAVGAFLIFILGLIDDILDLNAKLKLSIQALIITYVIIKGSLLMSFFIPTETLGFFGTLFWVLLIMNAFNLLDNMDGLCSGVSVITLGIHFILMCIHEQYFVAMFTILLFSIIIVFFSFNKPPAKVYLGDAGSLLIGFLIAVLSIKSTYYRDGQTLASVLTPILILTIPIYDVLTVMYIRYKQHKPFFVGDQNHFSHRLLALGFSQKQALVTILCITLAMGLGVILLSQSNSYEALLILGQVILLFFVIRAIEAASLKKQNELELLNSNHGAKSSEHN